MSAAVSLAPIVRMADGLHESVPPAVYHERVLGMVSKSALSEFARTPLHYLAWVSGIAENESTPALEFGSAYHCAQLEPERFASEYAVEPFFGDCRKTENKKNRDAWREANKRKTIISVEDDARIRGMTAAVRKHPLASKMLRDGKPELTALWTDKETGLRCRARADFYSPAHRMILDVKSCEDASPDGFRKSVFKYRYHWQHAIYRAGFAAVGERVEHFAFLAVEKKPPHAIATYTLDSLGVSLGHDRVRVLMRGMAECVATNEWPGYSPGIQTIETPAWET